MPRRDTAGTGRGAAARRRAAQLLAVGLLAAVFGAAPPDPAAAQDCAIRPLGEAITTTNLRDDSNDNFACIRQRLEALEAKRTELEERLAEFERQGAGEPGVYRNEDGRVIRDERHLAPATFVLTGDRRGRPRSLELDRARVLEMCGDAEGCLVTLGLSGVVLDGAPVRAMFSAGPCPFHLDAAEDAWALSGLCADHPLPAASGTAAEGPAWGRDGDARPLGDAGRATQVILDLGGVCHLAEAPPETRSADAGFARDTRPDLFLVTAGADWAPAGSFPAALIPLGLGDPDFRCSLSIRD